MSNPADLNITPQPDTDKNFFNFKSVNLNRWNMLAIDVLLILYSKKFNKFNSLNKILTIKNITPNSVGSKYNFFSKKYWLRRNQQIKYWENINKKKIYNLDKIVCNLLMFFIEKKYEFLF